MKGCAHDPRTVISADDRAKVDRFAEWLRNAGPVVGPLTEEQKAFRRRCFADPEWREFLGLPPLEETP